jgi:zinc/manganese transport system substrate-binding protein
MKMFLPFLTLIVFGLSGFPALADGIKIVAAENFYGGIAQQIAGDTATITSILTNPNQDPHEFSSNAQTAKAVADADIVIYNGLSYDPWMDKLLATGGKTNRIIIKVADLIGAKEGDNPHIWYDPRTMPALAAKLSGALSQKDAGPANSYQKRKDAFDESMKPVLALIAEIKAVSAGIEVTATEPVFGCMADALGFKMLNEDFQMKVMNDAEPTAAQTAAFEKSLTSREAKILFYNSQVTDPTTERMQKIAQKLGIPIIGVTETQPIDQKTYQDWMMTELLQIHSVLKSRKS